MCSFRINFVNWIIVDIPIYPALEWIRIKKATLSTAEILQSGTIGQPLFPSCHLLLDFLPNLPCSLPLPLHLPLVRHHVSCVTLKEGGTLSLPLIRKGRGRERNCPLQLSESVPSLPLPNIQLGFQKEGLKGGKRGRKLLLNFLQFLAEKLRAGRDREGFFKGSLWGLREKGCPHQACQNHNHPSLEPSPHLPSLPMASFSLL
ncbi:MAG: hypothetical protein HZLCBSQH_000895, partial [Candidatus Fervidibacterota bacterium]